MFFTLKSRIIIYALFFEPLRSQLISEVKKAWEKTPFIILFFLFLNLMLLGLLSFNFEIARVMRMSDMLFFVTALCIAVYWYGQKREREGYSNGLRQASEHQISKTKFQKSLGFQSR